MTIYVVVNHRDESSKVLAAFSEWDKARDFSRAEGPLDFYVTEVIELDAEASE